MVLRLYKHGPESQTRLQSFNIVLNDDDYLNQLLMHYHNHCKQTTLKSKIYAVFFQFFQMNGFGLKALILSPTLLVKQQFLLNTNTHKNFNIDINAHHFSWDMIEGKMP